MAHHPPGTEYDLSLPSFLTDKIFAGRRNLTVSETVTLLLKEMWFFRIWPIPCHAGNRIKFIIK